MHPSIETGPAALMAAWRASGGCAPEAAAGEAGGDDGLAASRVTSPAGGCPPFADDGLMAGNATRPPECWGVALIGDDGLSAANVSPTYPGFCWAKP